MTLLDVVSKSWYPFLIRVLGSVVQGRIEQHTDILHQLSKCYLHLITIVKENEDEHYCEG